MRFFPRPDLIIWVKVPPKICMERKDGIPSINHILRRIPYYKNLATHIDLDILDGTLPLVEIEQ